MISYDTRQNHPDHTMRRLYGKYSLRLLAMEPGDRWNVSTNTERNSALMAGRRLRLHISTYKTNGHGYRITLIARQPIKRSAGKPRTLNAK